MVMYKLLTYRIHVSALFTLTLLIWTQKLGIQNFPMGIILAFGSWHWSLYLFNRVTDTEEDQISQPKENLETRREFLLVLATSIVLLVWPIFWMIQQKLNPLFYIAFMPVGWLYSIRLPRGFRIKKILFLKNIYSAVFCWTLPAFVAVSAYGKLPTDSTLLPKMGIELALAVTLYEVIWDIRDTEGDRKAGVQTIATYFGPQASRWTAFAILNLLLAFKWAWFRDGILVTISYFAVWLALLWKDRKPIAYHGMILGQLALSCAFLILRNPSMMSLRK